MSRPSRDGAFRALADPTRRAILERLRGKELGVTALCEPFAMSQPAISQHLRVLGDAGLVRARRSGREQLYRLRAAPLREVFDWLEHFEAFWTTKLDDLGTYLDREEDEP